MSNVHYFPDRARKAPPELPAVPSFFQPHRSSLAEMRALMQSHEAMHAFTPQESELTPFYGTPASADHGIPFLVRAPLNFTGIITKLYLPNGLSFAPSWKALVRSPLRGGVVHGRLITKATWVGPKGNEPWNALDNSNGYARGSVLALCRELREGGCELRLAKNLQFLYRTEACAEGEEINRLDLTLAVCRS
jgi:hypothetical protein